MADVLPERYEFAHNYCFFLHDVLAHLLVDGEEAKVFHVRFELVPETEALEIRDLPKHGIWDWLQAKGKRDVIEDITYRMVCLALLSDFCHFVYEALQCSRKGKLAVTYALLRKPFKDNLFYFEWLLADRSGFLSAFLDEGPEHLERTRKIPGRRRELIAQAVSKTEGRVPCDPDYIYDLRYKRSAPFSFEQLWDKAHHLITTFEHIMTERQNFNFVFLNDEVREFQWHFLYMQLPFLLFYSVEVITEVVKSYAPKSFAPMDPRILSLNHLRRAAGFLLWAETIVSGEVGNVISQFATDLRSDVDCVCPHCGVRPVITRDFLLEIYETGSLICSACGQDTMAPAADDQ